MTTDLVLVGATLFLYVTASVWNLTGQIQELRERVKALEKPEDAA